MNCTLPVKDRHRCDQKWALPTSLILLFRLGAHLVL